MSVPVTSNSHPEDSLGGRSKESQRPAPVRGGGPDQPGDKSSKKVFARPVTNKYGQKKAIEPIPGGAYPDVNKPYERVNSGPKTTKARRS